MAAEYRLVSYVDGGKPKAGGLSGDRVIPASALLPGLDIDSSSVLGLLRAWDQVHPRLHARPRIIYNPMPEFRWHR